jgi:CheY-like chemotaxis protein
MKSILIVEDEITLLKVLKERFAIDGFTVYEANNGEEGLKFALNNHPDLILLDIIMPVMDGMTMLAKLRGDPWGKKVKVILLTNLSDAGKEWESFKEGASGYLIKSNWTLDEIAKRVDSELAGPQH